MKRVLQHKDFWRVERAKTSREKLRTKQRVLICLMDELHAVRRCSMKTQRKDLVRITHERLDTQFETSVRPRGPVRAVGRNVRRFDLTVLI